MNDMNREMRRMAEREERLAKKADRNVGQKNTDEKVSRLRRVFNYLSEVSVELKRVNWPSVDLLTSYTLVTVVTVAVVTVIIFGLDFGFKQGLINLLNSGR
ncbi:MAG: preprotein translocase subunit SecE [Actinomycetota bacterium]|nr:preprotein translocase subunit SecE [Actinomycetota bacterium]